MSDERAAIVAWLHEQMKLYTRVATITALKRVIDAIERGDHLAAARQSKGE